MRHLYPAHTTKARQQKCLDVETLAQCDELTDKYNIAVFNPFQALESLPEDNEESWQAVRNTILESRRPNTHGSLKNHCPFLTRSVRQGYAGLLMNGESIKAFLRHVLSNTC